MITQLFSIIAPVFFGTAFGYVWARLDKPFDAEFVTSLVFNLGTPLLVFSTLTKLNTDPQAFADLALVVVVALILFWLISVAVLKIVGLDLRTYLATVMIPNTGNVGLPLSFFSIWRRRVRICDHCLHNCKFDPIYGWIGDRFGHILTAGIVEKFADLCRFSRTFGNDYKISIAGIACQHRPYLRPVFHSADADNAWCVTGKTQNNQFPPQHCA